MNFNASPKMVLCVLLTLAGHYPASLCLGGEPLDPDTSDHRAPVVTGPVIPTVPLPDDRQAGPHYDCEAVVAPPPRRSSAGPAGNASGLPFGASMRALFGAQIANGHAARMVLYRYDFIPGRPTLARAGRRKLVRMAPALAQAPFALIIEPTQADSELDRSRRRTVIRALDQLAFPVSDEWVVVAPPPSHGMQGAEAYRVHRKFAETMPGAAPEGGAPARFQP